MKIICKQEKLVKALNIVSKAVSQTSTLEITKGILIKTEGDMQISLSATDIQISITTGMDAIVNEKGGTVVSARLFTDLVRRLPSGDILIATDEKNRVSIKTEFSEYDLQGKEEEEFPRIDSDEEGKKISLEKELLRDMIDGTAFAASIDEAKGIITGVLFEIKDGVLALVALDGFRVAIRREVVGENKGDEIKAIIPGKLMREISKILADTEGEEDVLLDIGSRRVKLFTGETLVRANLLDGEYIKYRDIPKESKISIVSRRNELLDAMERVAMLKTKGKSAAVRFSLSEKAITVSARADEGRGKETVFVEKKGEDLEIGFDAKFLIEALKAITDDEIEMLFNTGISPCMIRPVEGDRFEYLVMPVKLSTINA